MSPAKSVELPLPGLLVASRLWAAGEAIDEERVMAAKSVALLENHARYVQHIPAYRRLAEDLDLCVVDDVDTLVDELLVGVTLFKSYDERLLTTGDFAGLTSWLGDVSTLSPNPDLDGVSDIEEWRGRLRADGAFVSVSSGTTGRPSFVPRDAATLAALRSNWRWYSTLAWEGDAEFDCLLLVPPGTGLGIQAVATGLVRSAVHAHQVGQGTWTEEIPAIRDAVASSATARRRIVVFGTPPSVSSLCRAILDDGGHIALPSGSVLVTGGGWKSHDGDGEDSSGFVEIVEAALGLSPTETADVYGLAECNAYMIRCPAGRYHVPPVLEALVVDEHLGPLKGDDETGEIALLDPFAFSYPGFLLTGDVGRLVRTPCPCGLGGAGFVGSIQRAVGQPAKGCAGAVAGRLA